MTFEQLEKAVIEWAVARGINLTSNWQAQLAKTVEELGELSRACQKGTRLDRIDALGDVIVTLVLVKEFAVNAGFEQDDIRYSTLTNCLRHAYNTISARTGKVENGIFVKDDAQT